MNLASSDPEHAEEHDILVIEDDAAIGRLVGLVLSAEGFRVSLTSDGESGLASVTREGPDVVLLDLGLPGLSGLDTLTAIRKSRPQTAVIAFTATESESALVECLEAGAFDIASKPFEPDDLVACLQIAVGGGLEEVGGRTRVTSLDFEVDFASYRAGSGNQAGILSYSEWRLLQVLAARPGDTVLYQEILSRAWGPHFRNRLELLRTWMSRLQKKVSLAEFHGVGYALKA